MEWHHPVTCTKQYSKHARSIAASTARSNAPSIRQIHAPSHANPIPSLTSPSHPSEHSDRDNFWNGIRFSPVNAEVAREAETDWCWACDYKHNRTRCPDCGAPHWDGRVQREATDAPGVYVLASDVGMVKIGVSRSSISARISHLSRTGARHGVCIWLDACLPHATYRVERWLHETFATTRDRSWARAEFLPHPSEWFWPSPGLRDLVDGEAFALNLTPEQVREVA